ncbi:MULTISPECIES: hypothetical protein [unclassified Bradyrhizobium]|uniref:hypothetical protein n=1 Tax=unclassified Bradyrhizobium TaxID=2631580 RepID=UPI00247B15AF|nr:MULTISPECIES: hypothetical protein [unclassified Bradyrhizobium]WGS23627.1 hypothetical protein MTX22_19610 [Bradyrhizobium sp. ISRA463]WGS30654.1 hypothetical protein MTX19_17320 [Bradyrhizobium sp. ISRA464]
MPIKTNEMVSNSAGYGRALEGPVLIDDMRIFGSTAYARTRCQQRPKADVYPQRRPQRGPLRASRRDYFMSMHRASIIATAERAAARGEPWLSLFEPAELHELLRGAGFSAIENLGASE